MANLLSNALKGVSLKGGVLSMLQVNTNTAPNWILVRASSFFNKSSTDEIWDSMTSVSNVGKKRGRASRGRLMRKFNIYRGRQFQPIKASERILQRKEKDTEALQRKEKDTEASQEKLEIVKQKGKRLQKLHPLDKGYVGRSIQGRRVGPPINKDGYDFEEKGFQGIVLRSKYVGRMTATQKDITRSSMLIALGNKNGLAGYAFGKASSPNAAIQIAKRKAALKLMYFEPFNDRTLWHNFYEEYHKTRVYAFRKHEGYGLVCHNVIKSICQVFGIKDIYVKVEGQTKNYLSITAAFFNGLAKQKTHQELADDVGQNIVEYSPGFDYFPHVVAKPSNDSVPTTTLNKNYGFDYETYFFGSKPYHRKNTDPWYVRSREYKRRQYQKYRIRNQPDAKLQRKAYGLDGVDTFGNNK